MSTITTNITTDTITPTRPTTPTTTPITPIRPKRSSRRLTLHEDQDQSTPALSDSLQSHDNTPSSAMPTTPSTPATPITIPSPAHHRLANRKSTASLNVRRKPVPSIVDELQLYNQNPFMVSAEDMLHTPASASTVTLPLEPPRYILDVDMPSPSPLPSALDSPTRPPSYIGVDAGLPSPDTYFSGHSTSANVMPSDLSDGLHSQGNEFEDLPTYAEEPQTEPKTLARALWRWGFACPLLWIMGMFILWIPLKPLEEEEDPEKAQKLNEMILILRKTELKYAKRCMFGVLGLAMLILAVVIIAIAVSKAH